MNHCPDCDSYHLPGEGCTEMTESELKLDRILRTPKPAVLVRARPYDRATSRSVAILVDSPKTRQECDDAALIRSALRVAIRCGSFQLREGYRELAERMDLA